MLLLLYSSGRRRTSDSAPPLFLPSPHTSRPAGLLPASSPRLQLLATFSLLAVVPFSLLLLPRPSYLFPLSLARHAALLLSVSVLLPASLPHHQLPRPVPLPPPARLGLPRNLTLPCAPLLLAPSLPRPPSLSSRVAPSPALLLLLRLALLLLLSALLLRVQCLTSLSSPFQPPCSTPSRPPATSLSLSLPAPSFPSPALTHPCFISPRCFSIISPSLFSLSSLPAPTSLPLNLLFSLAPLPPSLLSCPSSPSPPSQP